jgi:hypothetical protein
MLDHSSILLTMDNYAHLMNPTNAEAADSLARLIFSGSGSNVAANTSTEVPDDAQVY